MLDAAARSAGSTANTSASQAAATPARRARAESAQAGLLGGRLVSGSAAVVRREGEMAIGGDQGADPASRPRTAACTADPTTVSSLYGIFPIEMTLDHTGPMTATVADNRCCSSAGRARRTRSAPDRRQDRGLHERADCESGLKIAVVKEGFGHPSSESDVDALVARAPRRSSARRAGRRGVDPVPLAARPSGRDRRRGRDWQMLNGNGFGSTGRPIRHEPHRRPFGLAPARRRVLRHAEDDGPVRASREQVPRHYSVSARTSRARCAPPTTRAEGLRLLLMRRCAQRPRRSQADGRA